MPEGPTLVVFKQQLQHFEKQIVRESGGYNNPFAGEITGQLLLRIDSYGKYLLFVFEQLTITVHFGLFGSLLVDAEKKSNAAFSLRFDNGLVNFYIVKLKKIADISIFNEQLNIFSDSYEQEETRRMLLYRFPNEHIGDVLLNQEVFPGLGNIIRNEVLFLAKLHPESTVSKIPDEKLTELLGHIYEFSRASVDLIAKKHWKASCAVYQKSEVEDEAVKIIVSPKIKRKSFVVESVQKKY